MAAIGLLPEYRGILLHDFWRSYFLYDKVEHAMCCAHLLRELVYAEELKKQDWAKPLRELLIEMLAERKRLAVLGQSFFDLSYRTVYDCFKRLVKKIGAPNARVHDLRHTYAVACIESGVDVKTLQENLGHATAAFTMDVYGHVSRQMQFNCASKLETFIQNVQPNRELEPASQAPETQEPCPI